MNPRLANTLRVYAELDQAYAALCDATRRLQLAQQRWERAVIAGQRAHGFTLRKRMRAHGARPRRLAAR